MRKLITLMKANIKFLAIVKKVTRTTHALQICTKLCRQLKCHQHISESDISLKVILRVCKCHITSFVKAPVLFFSLGVLCDAPLLPEGTSRCTHLAAHSSKRFNHLFATGYEMHQLMCHWSFQ